MVKIVQRQRQEAHEATLAEIESSSLMCQLFAARGMVDAGEMRDSLKALLPPDTLTNNAVMAGLLADAIAANQKILVVGDYDADGATASAVAVKGLRMFGATVDYIVPNRFEFGYGLTPEIVSFAHGLSPDILLTVDNGIASVEGVAHANALGMKVLVTDHHLPADITPDAACIVNPNQKGCAFESKHLAGVGVMFYVLMALRMEMRARGVYQGGVNEPNLSTLLDLVALGTVADLVKLDGNNRILVEQGLRRIRAGQCSKGILALLKVSGRDYRFVNAQDMGFYVGPRLNAAGRLEDMALGIQCLISASDSEAQMAAEELQALNQQRRNIESKMQEEANVSLSAEDVEGRFTLSLYDENWHQGVIGILASRVKEQYHRPVITFAKADDGTLKGSGRSIKGLHLRDALDLVTKKHPDLVVKFGGHAMAAGLSIHAEKLAEFDATFEQVVQSLITVNTLESVIEVDGSLPAALLSYETAERLEGQVWGQGFPEPLFRDVFEVVDQRILAEKHLKMTVEKSGQQFEAIYFNHPLITQKQVNLVYQLQVNRFRGQSKVQMLIRHLALDE